MSRGRRELRLFGIYVGIALAASVLVSSRDADWRAAVAGMASGRPLPESLQEPQFFGLEHGFIGAHVAAGRGFAGPYPDVTEPTAVMPPVLPLVFAAVFSVADPGSPAAFWLLFVLRVLCVAIGGHALHSLLVNLLPHTRARTWLWIGAVVAIVGSLAPRRLLFLFYDEPLLFAITALSLRAAFGLARSGAGEVPGADWKRIGWAGIGTGLVLLAQPILGFALALGSAAVGIGRRHRAWLAIPLIALLTTLPWAARNASLTGTWTPVKSTLFFELHYGTFVSPDGIHREEEVIASGRHPFFPGEERARAIELGERAYFAEKRDEFLAALAREPGLYVSKLIKRLSYATLVFPASVAHQSYFSPETPLALKYLIYPLPFAGWIALLALRSRVRERAFWRFVVVAYAAFLLPYVGIHFWLRYWVQALPLHLLLVLWGIELLRPSRDGGSGDRDGGSG